MEDVFSRLLGRKKRQQDPTPDPLVTFTTAWESVKAVLVAPDERMLRRGIASTAVPQQLQTMVDALVSETNGAEENETGIVLEYLLKNDVLATLERISEMDRPMGVRAEVLNAFNLLVALLDEKFLVHNAVHRPLRRLLRSCVGDEPEELLDGQVRVVGAAGAAGKGHVSDYEKDLLELMCMLCKRIRSYPSLLMIFFHDKALHVHQAHHIIESSLLLSVEDPDSRAGSPTPSATTGVSSGGEPKKEFEFLLFSYLLRFVHRESPIGEFSRAGILFLIDVAFSPSEDPSQEDPLADTKLLLAEFMLDGDFCDVLAAGLGAIYSLLPSKLVIKSGANVDPLSGGGMVLGGTNVDEENDLKASTGSSIYGGELSTDPTFQHNFDTFLKFLEFIQDVIKRGVSRSSSPALDTLGANSLAAQSFVGQAMSRAIVGCVKSTFFEHVLYPGILESDDADGSAVAVISYIDTMISTLEHNGLLSEELLRFLLADDDADEGRNGFKLSARFGLGAGFVVMPRHTDGVGRKKQALNDVKVNRRKSSAMILLENLKPSKSSQYFTSQGRFSLKDLILDNVSSSNPATAAAALKLLNTVLSHHASVGLRGLLAVLPDPKSVVVPFNLPALSFSTDDEEDESLSASRPTSPGSDVFVYPSSSPMKPFHAPLAIPTPLPPLQLPDWTLPPPVETNPAVQSQETKLYLSLLSDLNSSDPSPLGPNSLPSNYTNYRHDAEASLAADRSLTSFQLGLLSSIDGSTSSYPTSNLSRHCKLNPSDPLLRRLLDGLREFFVHSPEVNLALTGVLATIALNADLSLEGWLVFPREEDDEGADVEDAWAKADAASGANPSEGKTRPKTTHLDNPFTDFADTQPILYILFRNLIRKLERYRLLIPEFDHYLSERRQGLLFEENLADLLLDVPQDVFGTPTRPPPPKPTPSSRSSSPAPAPPSLSTPQPKPPKPRSFLSFLSPSKKPSSTPSTPSATGALPYTPRRTPSQLPRSTPNSAHYASTTSLKVERVVAESPAKGPWSPALMSRRGGGRRRERRDMKELGEESQFGLGSDEEGEQESEEEVEERGGGQEGEKLVSLSEVLDNVVILEECLKELVAIVVARRKAGV